MADFQTCVNPGEFKMVDRLEQLEIGLLKLLAKKPYSITEIMQIVEQNKKRVSQKEVMEALVDLECRQKIIQTTDYKFEIPRFRSATGETIQKDQTPIEDEKSPENQSSEKDQNFIPVKSEFSKSQKDQKPSNCENSPATSSNENSPQNKNIFIGVRILICPNPNCQHESEYKPNQKKSAKPLKTEKRERRLCKYCGKKFDLKYWIPKMDQTPIESEKSSENQGTRKDQKISPGQNKTERIQKDQSSQKVENSPTKLRLDQKTFEWTQKSPVKDVLEGIAAGLYQSNIAKKYNLSNSKLSRIILQLSRLKIIECYSHYPKFYKIIADLSVASSNLPIYVGPKGIHRAIFHTPLVIDMMDKRIKPGKNMWDEFIGDWPKNQKVHGWTQYINHVQFWKIEIGTRQIIWTYDLGNKTCMDPRSRMEELKKEIPFEFVEKTQIPMDKEKTYYLDPEIHTPLNIFVDPNTPSQVIYDDTGKPKVWIDHSDGQTKPHAETTLQYSSRMVDEASNIEKMTKIMESLNEKLDLQTKQLHNKNEQIDQLVIAMKHKDEQIEKLTAQFQRFFELVAQTPTNSEPPTKVSQGYRDNIQ